MNHHGQCTLKEQHTYTDRRHLSLCLSSLSPLSWRLLTLAQDFCTVCQHQHKQRPQSHFNPLWTHTHTSSHVCTRPSNKLSTYRRMETLSHFNSINRFIKYIMIPTLPEVHVLKLISTIPMLYLLSPLAFVLFVSLKPLQELPPFPFIQPSVRLSSPRWQSAVTN